MYIPSWFAQTDRNTLFDFIDKYSFGLVVSQHNSELVASHLPFLLDRSTGTQGQLLFHLARANPQWKQSEGQKVLAIFSGPHAYISPTWYQAEQTVPTWNYVAVHVYGLLERIETTDELIELLRRMAERYESGKPEPWKVDPGAEFIQKMTSQIVGFRIQIERIEGKWKLNQNHSEERRRRVIEQLRMQSSEDSRAIASLMEAGFTSSAQPES